MLLAQYGGDESEDDDKSSVHSEHSSQHSSLEDEPAVSEQKIQAQHEFAELGQQELDPEKAQNIVSHNRRRTALFVENIIPKEHIPKELLY